MTKILKDFRVLEKVNGENITYKLNLEYYLTEEVDGNNKKYGIEIINKKNLDNTIYMENKLYKDISTEKEIVENIIKSLSRNIVTPISFQYVLEDIL
jgi:hypothetical protein